MAFAMGSNIAGSLSGKIFYLYFAERETSKNRVSDV